MHLLTSKLLQNVLTWMWNRDGIALRLERRLAFRRRHVDQVHVGERVEQVVIIGATSDGYWSAVHVELSVTDAVVPCPSQRHYAVRKALRYREGEGMREAIAVRIDGTTALEYLDDLEGRVRRRLLVLSDGNLASTTTVRSRADEA